MKIIFIGWVYLYCRWRCWNFWNFIKLP